MKEKRNFAPEFKRQVIEELLSGVSRPAQLCRRHNIAVSLLYHWKKQYSLGKLNSEPIKEAALQERAEQLERLVGKLTLENEFLKKALQNNVNLHGRNGSSSKGTNSKLSAGDASL
jgi:transposase